MQSWLEGRIWVGKGAQATGMTASLRIQSSKADSNTWESFTRIGLKLESVQSWFKHLGKLHKDWTEAGVSASRVTTLRRLQEKVYQATSEPETTSEASYLGCGEKRTGLLLSGPKSSFLMKVNFAFHLEIKVPESGGRVERHRIHVAWSPVWSFRSQWWFGLPCHLLVLVHCVFWSPLSTQPSTRKF